MYSEIFGKVNIEQFYSKYCLWDNRQVHVLILISQK